MKQSMLFTLLLLLISLCSAELGPVDLDYMTENYPPANFLNKYEMLTGATVEILEAMWNEMGCDCNRNKIKLYPWARGYMMIQNQSNKVLFSMSRTEEREELFKWVGPIFTSRHVIVGLETDSTPVRLVTPEELTKEKIGVIRDDVGEQSLRGIGFPEEQLQIVSSQKQLINLLMINRVNYVSMSDDALRDLLELHDISGKFYIASTLDVRKNYIAFSKDVPDELIARFQKALDSIPEKHKEILQKYNMELYKGE